jgi:methyl-accepting chemotaxis protein
MNAGTNEVDAGIGLADQAGEALKGIVEISQRVTDMVTQIAAGSEEQASAAGEITANIGSMNTVIRDSVRDMEHIARSANELNNLISFLEQLVARFKLSQQTETEEYADPAHNQGKYDEHAPVPVIARGNGSLVPLE